MAFKFKKGTKVRQKPATLIEGEIVDYTLDKEAGEVGCLVRWTDAEGHINERHFREDDIEEAKAKDDEPKT